MLTGSCTTILTRPCLYPRVNPNSSMFILNPINDFQKLGSKNNKHLDLD